MHSSNYIGWILTCIILLSALMLNVEPIIEPVYNDFYRFYFIFLATFSAAKLLSDNKEYCDGCGIFAVFLSSLIFAIMCAAIFEIGESSRIYFVILNICFILTIIHILIKKINSLKTSIGRSTPDIKQPVKNGINPNNSKLSQTEKILIINNTQPELFKLIMDVEIEPEPVPVSKEKRKKRRGTYKPKNKNELKSYVEDLSINLGDIDTHLITDMSGLFSFSKRRDFSGIEKWDVSNVVNMFGMFYCCETFNEDISNWDMRKVEDTSFMLARCTNFDQYQCLEKWDLKSIKKHIYMFFRCNLPKNKVYAFIDNINSGDKK